MPQMTMRRMMILASSSRERMRQKRKRTKRSILATHLRKKTKR
jgi:hypothetical protein